jgi:hypothetical protein
MVVFARLSSIYDEKTQPKLGFLSEVLGVDYIMPSKSALSLRMYCK